MVVEDKLTESRTGGGLDDGVPGGRVGATAAGVNPPRASRFDDDGAEKPVRGLLPGIAVAVKYMRSLGLARSHHPFVGDLLARSGDRLLVGGNGRAALARHAKR